MQYSLRTLLYVIVAVAMVCAIFFGLPDVVSLVVLYVTAIFCVPAIVSGIVFFRGYARAFAIGCATNLPWVIWLWLAVASGGYNLISQGGSSAVFSDDVNQTKVVFAVCYGVVLGSGALAVFLRWVARRRRINLAPDCEPLC